jgi:hypothetical protein
MGGPSPPPLQNQASGFLPPIYKGTLFCPSFWSVKHPVSSVITNANIHLLFFQACEQLNSWIGGFQSIQNRMTLNNFKWYLHALLFLHTQWVIKRQMAKVERGWGGWRWWGWWDWHWRWRIDTHWFNSHVVF